jgi:hypothetical protein
MFDQTIGEHLLDVRSPCAELWQAIDRIAR